MLTESPLASDLCVSQSPTCCFSTSLDPIGLSNRSSVGDTARARTGAPAEIASQPNRAQTSPGCLHRRPAAAGPGSYRTDLARPDDKGRIFARPLFEPDGAITYPKREEDWEPPKNINGYVRDPNNAWRFLPLWLPLPCDTSWPFSRPIVAASTSSCDAIIPRHRYSAVAWTATACKQCSHRR